MRRLLVSAGRGPAECRIALGLVLERMAGEAEAAGLDLDVAPGPAPDRHGPASAVVVVEGAGEAAFAAAWTGSVLWTATSPLRPHHRRRNWYVGVFALPPAPPAAAPVPAEAEVRFEAFRAGGPGGQHQNKTASAVRAVHLPTGLAVVARDERSQHRNRALALARLARLLAERAGLADAIDRDRLQAEHDRLERGNPVRRL